MLGLEGGAAGRTPGWVGEPAAPQAGRVRVSGRTPGRKREPAAVSVSFLLTALGLPARRHEVSGQNHQQEFSRALHPGQRHRSEADEGLCAPNVS